MCLYKFGCLYNIPSLPAIKEVSNKLFIFFLSHSNDVIMLEQYVVNKTTGRSLQMIFSVYTHWHNVLSVSCRSGYKGKDMKVCKRSFYGCYFRWRSKCFLCEYYSDLRASILWIFCPGSVGQAPKYTCHMLLKRFHDIFYYIYFF